MQSSKSTHNLLPVFSLLVTATLWGVVWYPLRLLEQQGLSGLWTTLISYSSAMLLGIVWLWREKRQPWRDHPVALLLMMLAAGWCNVAFVLAILDGTVVRVLLLFYLSPFWSLLLGWLVLDERPHASGWLVFAFAVAGALTMLWDPAIGVPWPSGLSDWLAASSGLAFSISNVMVRRMGKVSLRTKSAVSWLGVVVVAAIGIAALQQPLPAVGLPVIGGAMALGWFGFVVMTLTVIYGVTHMPVHRSAIILLFELVAGAISSLLLTVEVILPHEWLGGGLILVSGWFAAQAQKVEATRAD
jgi:drug/metabolite transporter (DMT)-like permease